MHATPATVPERRAEPRTGRTESFLIRTWREGASEASNRYFIRNLKTGEEIYLCGRGALSEFFEPEPEPEPGA